ncbi:uncharacterized protein LOC143174539 [Nomia melanderi]|uniref:uncharacterized protein LOC143174539 n=1 Tax=Nomia melanderi TaxID=2448451 RepID=UPI003FCC8801
MTENLAAKLKLPAQKSATTIEALNQMSTVATKLITATIKSRMANYQRVLTFYTIPKISGPTPDQQIDRANIPIPPNIRLADPQFHRPGTVDMLIGTGPALSCLSIGQRSLSPRNGPDMILQKTQFGWIIGGSVPTAKSRIKAQTFLTSLQFDLRKFWELEDGPHIQHLTSEERECEEHFKDNVTRDSTGRYVVALPFNEKKRDIAESRSRALNRLAALERKLKRDSSLKREYSNVMKEYLDLGHMSQEETPGTHGFYLPHHAVLKESSETTKVRVVFDGSAKSNSGVSLNDALITGPTIQDDLLALLLRFRMHAYVITGDIEKMYRQFIIRPEDRPYQRILWRDEHNNIKTYTLNTVTFGLTSAPYLAIRCLHQLAQDEQNNYPVAADVLRRDLYVDDLITGANTYTEALNIRDQMLGLLKRGGLNIRQWVSNHPRLLGGLSTSQIHPKVFGDTMVKTLGVSWDSRRDNIIYVVDSNHNQRVTKRNILSAIAKIFDPLGLLAPVIVTAKILMQRLWQLQLDWDESLPALFHTEWTTYVKELPRLEHVRFERHVSQRAARRIELHGFCDASERAYGACIYIRTIDSAENIKSQLLCAKSRVAPLKTATLARLELCGAVLLASLYTTVRDALTYRLDKTYFWTDSTIVLNWLQKEPNTLKTFVANRVAEIQKRTDIAAWNHVRSNDNPADLVSRGQTPSEFARASIWYHGPQWLSHDRSRWPESRFAPSTEVPESRPVMCLATSVVRDDGILRRFSCIKRLQRIVAYCLRFKKDYRANGPPSVEEIRRANERVVLLAQASAFATDLHRLDTERELSPKSKLLPLHPFRDKKGILRVGGRLQNSDLPFDQKHPILLPKGHYITELIIRQTHIDNHHAGLNTTLHNIRQRYWPIDGKNSVRKIIRQCIRCFRVSPPSTEYVMGRLPITRVTQSRPFQNCGIDYCGPFSVKEKKYRNRARVKVYVAVFVCFATKAVHLEVVSDMTTEAFIAALKRFISRRGICRNIYSDNGTNFVGANNELTRLYQDLQGDDVLRHFLTDKEMSWHFIPSISPNFGGLWEAAVKSFKHHLRRVMGDNLYTFEHFNTIVIEIEAILNSRPLTPLSSDPNDPSALTPAHFLIGNSLTGMPETSFHDVPSNRLSSWQHAQKVKQDFWTRWHKEYIHHLNVRQKWTRGSHEIKTGSLVVLKNDHLPPLQWDLGRIEAVHPGSDGVIRAVTVRTANGTFKRNVKQLALLPTEDNA